jgi:hypothetical protein
VCVEIFLEKEKKFKTFVSSKNSWYWQVEKHIWKSKSFLKINFLNRFKKIEINY